MATVTKETLQARISELEAERVVIQEQIDEANRRAEACDRLMAAAVKAYDLEGNDSAKFDIEKQRDAKAAAQAEVVRLQGIRESFPARIQAIRNEIDHTNHREDLRLLSELKRTEQAAYLEYEKAALALLDAHYNFLLKRGDRAIVAMRAVDFARAHNVPLPSNGDFYAPPISDAWDDTRLADQVRRQFSEAKRGFN